MSIIISHSELEQYLSCEFKHYFGSGVISDNAETSGLEPVAFSDGLFRGLCGHAALEVYYNTLRNYQGTIDSWRNYTDAEQEIAQEAALAVIVALIEENPTRVELLMKLYALLDSYFLYVKDTDKQYFILAVEEEFHLKYVDIDIIFPFKPDLIWMHKATHKVDVVDHKFLQDFYQPGEMALMSQLPKYVGSLRLMNKQANDGVYNIIRYRPMKDPDPERRFRRIPLKISEKRILTALTDQFQGVYDISYLKSLPISTWHDNIIRTANSFNCKNCSFQSICIADLEGRNTEVMERVDYKPNTYHYDANADIDSNHTASITNTSELKVLGQ